MTTSLAGADGDAATMGAPIEKRPLERYVAPAKPSLVGLSRVALAEALGGIGVPERQRRMRVQQIWHWLHVRGVQDFGAMTTLSKEMRAELDRHFTLARPEIVAEQTSVDGTRKWLLRLPGETPDRPHDVECVYIPETDRGTLCISSQVGCTLNCIVLPHRHAAAGAQSDAGRDRRPGAAGARPARRLAARRSHLPGRSRRQRLVSNVVFMGMGEPLYNFEAVRDALAVVADGDGLSLSKRRITLSTSGVVPNDRARRRGDRLHARDLAARGHRRLRDELVPLNRNYPIARIARRLPGLSGLSNARRITFEYVMLKGVNDRPPMRARWCGC